MPTQAEPREQVESAGEVASNIDASFDSGAEGSSAQEPVAEESSAEKESSLENESPPAASFGALGAALADAGVADAPAEESSTPAQEAESQESVESAEAASEEAAETIDSAAEAEEEEPDDDGSVLPEIEPHRAALPWYVVHTYSGYELFAKKSLEERIRQRNLVDSFGNVLIPQDTVVELVRGQKKTSKRKFFPGYILVQIDLNDETWHLVKETPKVTGLSAMLVTPRRSVMTRSTLWLSRWKAELRKLSQKFISKKGIRSKSSMAHLPISMELFPRLRAIKAN